MQHLRTTDENTTFQYTIMLAANVEDINLFT